MSPNTIPDNNGSTIFPPYVTNEFNNPTTNNSTNQAPTPDNTNLRTGIHPSGEAKTTGTPITRINERAMKAKSAS